MKANRAVMLFILVAIMTACGGGGSSITNPTNPPLPMPQGSALGSLTLHDMPPVGVTVLSFHATITGMSLQPGGVSILDSPMTLEMTQLQGTSAYMGTVSVPAGAYNGMTITLSNPVMTFLNNTGGMMGGGGMMGEAGCAKDQICQINPTMMALSISITGPPFPINLQANTSFNLQMDFDLMDSMQSNMSVNPMMSSMMQEGPLGSDVFEDMDDMIGQVSAVNSGSNQLTMSFVQGMPSMTITADANTSFEGFDGIGKPNSFAGLAQGQIVLARVQLLAGGSLHAEKIRFETSNPQVLDGMIVAVNNSTQFDMVITNEAPAFAGMSVGSLLRMNVQAGSVFDMDDMDMPVSGMSFTSPSDLMVCQVVQIEPTSGLVNGTPPELNTNHVRLMKTWMTAKVASKIDPNTFSVNSLPGMFGNVGIATIKISGSAQTSFENVSGISALNAGDTVSVRGPMFLTSGMPTFIASKIQKR